MTVEIDLIAGALVAARTGAGPLVGAEQLSGLSEDQAMAVQAAVRRRLGQSAPVVKLSLSGETALVAPILSDEVVTSGASLVVGEGTFLGLEIEVAAVLGEDLTAEHASAGRAGVLAAVSHFSVGIELIGTRLDDRTKAGRFGALADNLLSMGYVIGRQAIPQLPAVDGLAVKALIDDRAHYLGEAKHPFGDALAPLLAYARHPSEPFGTLRTGTVVTTGSLVNLLNAPKVSSVSIALGDYQAIEVHLLERPG
ncbi:hypothetical protein [Solirhodobacter olei]|uniref:hypothetical protein n=1 Tax=Solirhodobacter olei TaxID=2493082 RepID=UPI000FD72E5D|nr:hypothetical protein [Solirhodobacter olei]